MQIIFDVAAILRAVLWPIVVLLLLVVYYNKIPDLIRGVAGRVTKLQFSGISVDLASAKPFAPDWTSPNALDLRNNQGRIGAPYAPNDPGPSLELLSEYLRLVQMPPVGIPMPPNEQDWVRIDTETDTWEHALWLNAETLEALLGDDLDTTMLRATPWQAKSRQAQIQQLLDQPGDFVALVSDEQRLENLVNRKLLLEQVAAALKA